MTDVKSSRNGAARLRLSAGSIVVLLAAAACSTPSKSGTEGVSFGSDVLETTKPSSISSDWVSWDPKS